ncbi:MAG: acetylxylan esterase [Phycisphaerae bacterium]|nr:acetylxylan esterase [Phycisphaerae bacterium]
MKRRLAISAAAVFFAAAAWCSGQELTVLPEQLDGGAPRDMMKRYFVAEAARLGRQWQTDYEARVTPEQIATYQAGMKAKFVEAIGGLPERTPLNARVTGVIERAGYTVEKVIFESRPRHFVTALLFVPADGRFAKPYPGVLVPCGHSDTAKAYDLYQRVGALMALNGMAALVFDPIDQGERSQYLDANGKAPITGTRAHTMLGVGAILLGRNTAGFEIWDGMRAIDYLQSRPEIDAAKIGCTGNSGGGTQTAYLMALDDRVAAAMPCCYITSFDRLLNTIGCQDAEQNIFGQLAFGMDHADYVLMRAPRPTLIGCATKDYFDITGAWESFRRAKRLYARMGAAECVEICETDFTHGWNLHLRNAAARWMSRWLAGRDEAISEPDDIVPLSLEEARCTPAGQVMLLDGARSTYDINIEHETQLTGKRKALWQNHDAETLTARVRDLAGIRRTGELKRPAVRLGETLRRDGFTIEKFTVEWTSEIYLPVLKFKPAEESSAGVVVYVNEAGKDADAGPGGAIEALVRAGKTVFAVDVRGTGETKQSGQRYGAPFFGTDGQDVYAAYVMGRSYVGMRAEDIAVCAELAGSAGSPVELVAVGNVGVPALHAAACEPKLFSHVTIRGALASWSSIIHAKMHDNQLVNAVHGALTVYDLPDLVRLLDDKITIEQPVGPDGKPLIE